MRIGIVTHNYPPHPGGLETIVHELVRGFARHHDVTVVTTAWEGRTGVTSENGATVHRLPAWHGAERRGVPYALPLGRGVLQAFEALRICDVLHAHGSLYATTVLASLARRRNVPLFITEHVGFVPYSSAVLNEVQRVAWRVVGDPAARSSATMIAYNSRVHEWLTSRFGAQSVVLIPNGVDTVTFCPHCPAGQHAARARFGLPMDGVLALFVGRAAEKKNIEAVLRFPATGYRLVVCGAQRTLPPGVLNLGVVPHSAMADVFAAADFLVHAAVGEGFPVAIQEAMASGLPVTLLWDPGYSGSVDRDALVSAETLEDLGKTTCRLATDAGLRDQFGRRSREFALENWKWEVTVARHLNLFERRRLGTI